MHPIRLGRVNPLRRAAIRLGSSTWLPRLAPVVVRLDTGLYRVTGGRLALMSVTGLPDLTLTVLGRRTGRPRSVPLLGVPHGSGWLVAGSNWGGDQIPAWAINLEAAGTAVVTRRGRDTPMSARRVQGSERDELWAVMLRTWPNFARYAGRTTREIPVFVLTPSGPTTRHRRPSP